MSEYDVKGKELKAILKKAKKEPLSFGFNPGKDEDDTFFGMHKTKGPQVLGRAAKEEGAGSKWTFGTALVKGKELQLTCERDLPQAAKKLKKYLKKQKVMLNVILLDENGNILDSDIEDGLPDDPEMEGDDDAPPAPEASTAAPTSNEIPVAPPPGNEATPAPNDEPAPPAPPVDDAAAALRKRLADIGAQIKALAPEVQAKIMAPFQQVVGLAKGNDVPAATAGAEKIEKAIALLAGTAPQSVPPAPPPPDPQMLKLTQLVAALRGKAEAVTDAARQGALLNALGQAAQMIQAREAEKAVAVLKRVQEALKALEAAPSPTSSPTQESAPVGPGGEPAPTSNGEDAEWLRRYTAIEPSVTAALSQGLVADVNALRIAFDTAIDLADAGNYGGAVQALGRVQQMLDAGREDGKSSFQAEIPAEAKPLAAARVRWIGVRAQMRSEMKKLEAAILSALADDEEAMAEIGGSVGSLSNRLDVIDSQLEDVLDQIVNTAPGEARDKLKDAARKKVDEYTSVLADSFFQEVDQGNGFLSVAIGAPARASLQEISATLA